MSRTATLLGIFWLGVKDGFSQGVLSSGMTWNDDQDKNEAYDRGATWGERFSVVRL